MTIKEIFAICASLLASLGGGALIITSVIKWFSDIFSQNIIASIQKKNEKDLAAYKSHLESISEKHKALINQSSSIFNQQYTMEVEIYKDIWLALYEVSICIDYVNDFKMPVTSSPTEYLQLLNQDCNSFSEKLSTFKNVIARNAPFYQESIYQLLIEYYRHCSVLQKELDKCKNRIEGLYTDQVSTIDSLVQDLETIHDILIKDVRNYLVSCKTSPQICS